jgi:hypothetical protein
MKIKLYQKGGTQPYITNNSKDPRIQARQDSIDAFNYGLNTMRARHAFEK